MLRCLGDQCTVATGDRDLCMYEGVPQTVCENEGCCYDTMTSPNCYYSNAEGMHEFQHPAGTSVISALFKGFYNGGL